METKLHFAWHNLTELQQVIIKFIIIIALILVASWICSQEAAMYNY